MPREDVNIDTLAAEVAELVDSALVVLRPDGRIDFANRVFRRLTSASYEVVGTSFWELPITLAHGGTLSADIAWLARGSGSSLRRTLTITVSGLGERRVLLNARRLASHDGKILLALRDVTVLHRLTARLDKDRRVLNALLEFLPAGIVVTDERHVVTACSRYVADLTGVPYERLLGSTEEQRLELIPVFGPDGVTRPRKGELPLSRAAREGRYLRNVELLIRHGDSLRRVSVSAAPIRDRRGRIVGAAAAWYDITDQSLARRQAEEERARLQAVFQSVSEGIMLFDMSGNAVLVNQAQARISGYQTADDMRKDLDHLSAVFALTTPDGIPIPPQHWPIARVLRGESVREIKVRARRTDIDREWIYSLTGEPVLDPDGRQVLGVIVTRDVTRRSAEEQLRRETENRYAALFNARTNGIGHLQVVCDNADQPTDFVIVDINTTLEQILGKPRRTLRGSRVLQIFPDLPSIEFDLVQTYGTVALHGGEHTREMYIPDRKSWYSTYVFSPKRGEVVVMLTDITDRKLVEQQLRGERELLQTILDTIPAMLTLYDPSMKHPTLNKAVERITGWTNEDAKHHDIMKLAYPDPTYRKGIRRYMQSLEPGFRDIRMTCKDGTIKETSWANVGLPDGRQVGIGIDITERKKLEQTLNRRSEELSASNKEIEAFSYSVSHDLRAPLRTIAQFVEFIREDCEADLSSSCRDHLQRISAAVVRMNTLIDDMLALSQVSRQEIEPENLDLTEMAGRIIEELRLGEPDRDVAVTIQPGLSVRADRRLMNVALRNLLGNAWKYTRKTARAQIAFGSLHRGGQRVYYVKDNGAGFDMERADTVFKPFVRLHSEREFPGTGVGLAIVDRAISRHGGKVWAVGRPGRGATFYFRITP